MPATDQRSVVLLMGAGAHKICCGFNISQVEAVSLDMLIQVQILSSGIYSKLQDYPMEILFPVAIISLKLSATEWPNGKGACL